MDISDYTQHLHHKPAEKEELWLCTIETRHRYTGWLRTWRMHETSVSAYTSIR